MSCPIWIKAVCKIPTFIFGAYCINLKGNIGRAEYRLVYEVSVVESKTVFCLAPTFS